MKELTIQNEVKKIVLFDEKFKELVQQVVNDKIPKIQIIKAVAVKPKSVRTS